MMGRVASYVTRYSSARALFNRLHRNYFAQRRSFLPVIGRSESTGIISIAASFR